MSARYTQKLLQTCCRAMTAPRSRGARCRAPCSGNTDSRSSGRCRPAAERSGRGPGPSLQRTLERGSAGSKGDRGARRPAVFESLAHTSSIRAFIKHSNPRNRGPEANRLGQVSGAGARRGEARGGGGDAAGGARIFRPTRARHDGREGLRAPAGREGSLVPAPAVRRAQPQTLRVHGPRRTPLRVQVAMLRMYNPFLGPMWLSQPGASAFPGGPFGTIDRAFRELDALERQLFGDMDVDAEPGAAQQPGDQPEQAPEGEAAQQGQVREGRGAGRCSCLGACCGGRRRRRWARAGGPGGQRGPRSACSGRTGVLRKDGRARAQCAASAVRLH